MNKKLLAIQSGIYLGALALTYPVVSKLESMLGNETFIEALKDPTDTMTIGLYSVLIPLGLLSTIYNSRD